MITIKTASTHENIFFKDKFSLGIYGNVIDDRTEYSTSLIKQWSSVLLNATYSRENLNLIINGESVECHDFQKYLHSYNLDHVIVDSTSLDVPELALIFKSILLVDNIEFIVLYVEPDNYTPDKKYYPTQENFELSDEIIGFEGAGIPSVTYPVLESVENKFIFFSGFEEARTASAFEVFDISCEQAQVIFGVPAFKPGWELTSFKKNIRTLEENNLQGRIEFCSASCASSALDQLRKLANGNNNGTIYILPLGTKPSSIASLLFINEHERAKLLFDQPRKKTGRSTGVGQKNIYKVYK